MERNQGVDILSESCFPLLENSKFNGSVEKCPSAKLSDKILQKSSSGNASNFSDSAFLNEKNSSFDHSFSNSVAPVSTNPHFNSNSYQHFEEKKQELNKIPDNVAGQELMRNSGVGRGKHRMKFSSIYDEKDKMCSFDSDTDRVSNSVQLLEAKSASVSNSESNKMVKASSDSVDIGDKCDGIVDEDSCEHFMQASDGLLKDGDTKNVPNSNMERFREQDYRRVPNGLDSTISYKGYAKGKPFRLSRFHNNASPMQCKYDGRPMPKQFPLPQTLNALRTVKGNEAYYRHNEGRRNQSSKTPFYSDVDKMVHAKQRSQLCVEKDMLAFDSNRNMPHGSNKSDMNNHLPASEPFISRPVLSMFHRRSFGSKNDHVNNSKHWSSNRLYSDSSTATVSCHSRTMVTSAKSVEPRHCGSCNVDKNGNNGSLSSKPDPCDGGNLESSECLSPCNKEVFRLKANCSPGINNSNSRTNTSECMDSSNDSVHVNAALQTSMHYPALGDNSGSDPDSTRPLSSESDTADRSVVSGLSSCDSHSENLHSSHCKGQENVVSPKQAVSLADAGMSPTNYSSSNRCSPFSMSAAHASYADIIRTPTAMHKVSVSSLFHSPGNSVNRASETGSTSYQDMLQKEAEQASSSSEWIISRLSQVNASANLNGGGLPLQTGSNHDGVLPRPIAVSLEKPSFYNSSLGIAKTLNSCMQQSSLSSPEKRMLECQFVEEHLCSMLSNEKSVVKMSFLSELPAALPSPGEHSNSVACTGSRTDSVFSDSSSVCSSTSGTFKTDLHHHVADAKPPVIIMNNCMPMSNMSGISFGIEMDEIMQICSDTSKVSGDTSIPQLPEVVSKNSVNKLPAEKEVPSDTSCIIEHGINGMNFITIGGKRLLWKPDEVDVSRCNLGNIMDFLQESWHQIELAAKNDGEECIVRYYDGEE